MFHKLETAEYGIVFRQFSEDPLDKENILGPGFQLVAPWNDLIKYDVSKQKEEMKVDIIDKDGLNIDIDVTVIFYPKHDKLGYLHEAFKGRYIETLILPELRSIVRKVAGQYDAEEIFSTKRVELQTKIQLAIEKKYEEYYVSTQALLIRSVKLPEDIKKRIEEKLAKKQEAQAMKFVKEKARFEAERKVIEANGIAEYNRIINASLNDKILRKQGIEATLQLAESENAKIVIVGSGKDGLPIILNNK